MCVSLKGIGGDTVVYESVFTESRFTESFFYEILFYYFTKSLNRHGGESAVYQQIVAGQEATCLG